MSAPSVMSTGQYPLFPLPTPASSPHLKHALQGMQSALRTAAQLGLSVLADQGGVKIVAVQPSSLADKKGLKVGDHIRFVHQKQVSSEDELNNALTSIKKGMTVFLLIRREGQPDFSRFMTGEELAVLT